MKNYPLYEHTQVPTLKALASFCAEKYGAKPAFQYADKRKDVSVSFTQFRADVDALGTWLYVNGYKGCHIAVYGENSYEWILSHFAVTCGKNVVVPIDKELTAEQIAALIRDSQCCAIIFSHTYFDVADQLREMELGIDFIDMKSIPKMTEDGTAFIQQGNREYVESEITKDDLASIVYTSGTTGNSKGVMLTHGNFCTCAHGACCNVLNTGTVLLVLPLHHTFGLTASVFSVMMYGNPVYINRSLKRLSGDFQKGRPQLVFVVPMILEALYKNIWNTAKQQGKDTALCRLVTLSDILLRCGIDLRKKLFKTILDSFGGNLELIVSGGAPLDEKYVKGFCSFGINVINGYGITECGPVVAVGRNHFSVPGSVGIPLCCNEVKISDEGEILVRGANVMAGYYHNDLENAKVFSNGWFHTGDLGFIDKFGALHITGRIKNLIILSNGENISAESLETLVAEIPYVKEVVVYGKKDAIVAEVFLDEDVSNAKQRIHGDIQAINKSLPLVKNIGNVVVRDTEFPKTTTKKIKRNHGGENHAR